MKTKPGTEPFDTDHFYYVDFAIGGTIAIFLFVLPLLVTTVSGVCQ